MNKIFGIDEKIEDYNYNNYNSYSKNIFEPEKIRNHVFWGTNPYKSNDVKKILYDEASAQIAKNDFQKYLLFAKGGILLFLVLIIIVYQIYFVKLNSSNKTFYNDKRTAWKQLVENGIVGFIGLMSVFIVNCIRLGLKNSMTWECFQVYITVFIFIFLFDLSEEASGFNRYMANISGDKDKNDEYKEIDGDNDDTDINDKKDNSDPFLTSTAYVTISLGIFALLYFVFNMIRSAIRGKISGMNNITSTTGGLGIFSLELFIVVVLNFTGPIVSKLATGGIISSSTYFSSFVISVIALILQIMCQYTGLIPKSI